MHTVHRVSVDTATFTPFLDGARTHVIVENSGQIQSGDVMEFIHDDTDEAVGHAVVTHVMSTGPDPVAHGQYLIAPGYVVLSIGLIHVDHGDDDFTAPDAPDEELIAEVIESASMLGDALGGLEPRDVLAALATTRCALFDAVENGADGWATAALETLGSR